MLHLGHSFAEMTERLGAWLQTTILGFNSQSRPIFFIISKFTAKKYRILIFIKNTKIFNIRSLQKNNYIFYCKTNYYSKLFMFIR